MAIYNTSDLGTAANKITFNDFDHSPLYRVIRRAPTRREIREYDIPLPEHTGVADFQTYIGKTYFIIDGIMYPNDETEYHVGRQRLRKLAALSVSQEDANSDRGYVPYVWAENGVNKVMYVKVLYVDMQESTRQGIVQPFRLLCKIKYPIIFDETPQSQTITVGTTSPTGGVIAPFIVPVILGASSSSTSLGVENRGDTASYPTFTIKGPIYIPRLTYVETGEYIELNVNLTSGSDTLIISYDQDSAPYITLNGTNSYSKLTTGSKLFKIRPGTVTLTLTGSSVGTGAQATVSFQSAYSLS